MKSNLAWYGGQKRHYPAVKTVEAEASGAERLVSLARLFSTKACHASENSSTAAPPLVFFTKFPYLLFFLFCEHLSECSLGDHQRKHLAPHHTRSPLYPEKVYSSFKRTNLRPSQGPRGQGAGAPSPTSLHILLSFRL